MLDHQEEIEQTIAHRGTTQARTGAETWQPYAGPHYRTFPAVEDCWLPRAALEATKVEPD